MATAHGGAGRSFFARLKDGLNFSFSSGSAAIGLSIGASSIKILELKKKKDSWEMEKFAMVPLAQPGGDQRDLVNRVAVSQAIVEAVKKAGITSKEVCSALVGTGLIIKNLTIVVTDMKELQDQVYWEAEQYIPFDISEVVLDFQIINQTKDQVEVILIAVKKDFLEQYMGVISEAKLTAKIMDAEVFALQNAFEMNYSTSKNEAMLLADVGAASTKIVICSGGIPFFTKDASFGGMMITQEIQRELHLPSMRDAEALKVSGNLPHEVSEVVARTCMILGTELKKAIDFYTASSLGPPIVGILLSGGAARSVHLSKIVEEVTGLPTQTLNPFQKISANEKKYSLDFLSSIGPEAVIPIGLAARGGEKK